MVRIVRIRQLQPGKTRHNRYDHSSCCERHTCRVYVEEKPEMLRGGRSDVDQTGRLR